MTKLPDNLTPVQKAMLSFRDAGFGVLPVKDDKTKAPAVDNWKQYEDTPPTFEVDDWVRWGDWSGSHGLGIVCGKSSGNLEMLEFEGRAAREGFIEKFVQAVGNYGLGKLWGRIVAGYMEFSPSGGIHVLYRVSDADVPGNTVFARRGETDEEMAARDWTKADCKRGYQAQRAKTMAETRGQGGYVVVAPTEAVCHELNQPYVLYSGSPETVVTITWAEWEKIASVLRELSTWVPPATEWGATGTGRKKNYGGPAGHAYAAEFTWHDILSEEGWRETTGRDGDDGWLHPDATSKLSALSNDNTLTVFSSSTPFGSETPLSVSKFEAYAVFNHEGDFTAAEQALREGGWGDYSAVQPADRAKAFMGDEAAQQRLLANQPDEDIRTSEVTNLPAGQPDARNPESRGADTPEPPSPAPYVPPAPAVQAPAKNAFGGEVLPPPSAPLAVADFIFDRYRHAGLPTLMRHDQSWLKWNGSHWDEFEDEAMRRVVYDLTRKAVYHKSKPDGSTDELPWVPNSTRVSNVCDALSSVALVPAATRRGGWLNGQENVVIPCANGLLDVRQRVLLPATPAYFGLAHVNASWSPQATAPWWTWFLDSLWGHDPDSVRLLRQWFGYVVSGRTDLQKILLVTGPKRSGKGTIARVLESLCAGAFCGPTLGSLGQHFGLQPLLGKTMAVVSDMRLSPKDDRHLMAERLLAISGEDTIDVERKHKGGAITSQLPLRFALMSNEVPEFPDAAGALASRFLVLTMSKSFYGTEDTALKGKILAELPGIINWALDGLDDLERNGKFIETASSATSRQELLEGSSEYLVYAEERMVRDPTAWVKIEDVYQDWVRWSAARGGFAGKIQSFGKYLRTAVGDLDVAKRGPAGNQVKVYLGWKLKGFVPVQPSFNGNSSYNSGVPVA